MTDQPAALVASFMHGYQRLDFLELRARTHAHAEALGAANDAQQAVAAVLRWDALRSQVHAMWNRARLQHTLDSTSEWARAELRLWNAHAGDIAEIDAAFGAALIACPERSALEEHFGAQIIRLAECDRVAPGDGAASLVDEEANLVSRYHELTSQTMAEVHGTPYNVLKARKLLDSPERDARRLAWTIRETFCRAHGGEIDHLFDRLVHVRTELACAASFTDYVQFGHLRARRIGYSAADVERFLTSVEEYLAPVAQSRIRRRRELHGRDLMLWDEEAPLTSVAATAPMTELKPSETLNALAQLLAEVHPEFVPFMATMTTEKMFDIESRAGKSGHGQCWVLPDVRLPFVVAQMDGTPRDVWSLLHEFGHAFHAYCARSAPLMDYIWPTSDGAELVAGGLTYLCMGKTSRFFGSHAEAEERKEHERLLLSVLRGAQLERFQHAVYSTPNMSHHQRRELWARLERRYFPWREYPAEFTCLRGGAGYALIPHLFGWPFSGLDFALAFASLQFHRRAQHDRLQAITDYLAMCDLGGSRSFPELLDAARLSSPFDPSTIRGLAVYASSLLDA